MRIAKKSNDLSIFVPDTCLIDCNSRSLIIVELHLMSVREMIDFAETELISHVGRETKSNDRMHFPLIYTFGTWLVYAIQHS